MTFANTKRRSGFTLIELLVVIAIIAILAAILFPVFAQARAKARQTSCLSNLKQMGTAFMMYSQDYDEAMPYFNWAAQYSGGSGPGKEIWSNYWSNAIYPYVKNAQMYACPSDRANLTPLNSSMFWWTGLPTNNQQAWVDRGWVRELLNQKLSYGYNEHFQGNPVLAAVDRPAQALLVADSITSSVCCANGRFPDRNNPADPNHKFIIRRVSYANQCDGTWYGGADQNFHNAAWEGNNCTRHSGGANIAYMDGHAKWSKAQAITDDLYFGDQAN